MDDPALAEPARHGPGSSAGDYPAVASLSLSQTSSGWQLIENQAILLWDEGSLQTYWFDGGQSAPVAGSARGRDLDVAAANKRSTAGCSKETLLQYHRPIDIRWALSVVSWSLRCVGDR
jgi:hypothetical protein